MDIELSERHAEAMEVFIFMRVCAFFSARIVLEEYCFPICQGPIFGYHLLSHSLLTLTHTNTRSRLRALHRFRVPPSPQELKSAQSAQGHLEEQLLAAHQRIQELEIEATQFQKPVRCWSVANLLCLSHQVCQGQPVSEVQQIKSENAELHQRLEEGARVQYQYATIGSCAARSVVTRQVFYKAMEQKPDGEQKVPRSQ